MYAVKILYYVIARNVKKNEYLSVCFISYVNKNQNSRKCFILQNYSLKWNVLVTRRYCDIITDVHCRRMHVTYYHVPPYARNVISARLSIENTTTAMFGISDSDCRCVVRHWLR